MMRSSNYPFFMTGISTETFNAGNVSLVKDEGFAINNDGTIDAPCGCPACDNGIAHGHFSCEQPDAKLLELETIRAVVRAYDDGAWRWFVAQR